MLLRFWRRLAAGLAFLLLACPGVAATITLAAIGDYGSGDSNEADVANLVKSWKPDFILTLGDNNYPAGSALTIDTNIGQFYHEFIHPYQGRFGEGATSNRFFPTLGNHDWWTPGARPYLDYFQLPGNERYYKYRHGFVEVFALDSDDLEPDGNTPFSRQAMWLRRELLASKAIWKLVYFHEAPYSSGYWHGTWTGEARQMLWPFKEWGASAVLCAHDHIYERLEINGLTYIVNGLGGDRIDQLYLPPTPGSITNYIADHGALRLDATETNLTFRFMNRAGTVIDTHVLRKPLPPGPRRN
jgi:hypothetical protein